MAYSEQKLDTDMRLAAEKRDKTKLVAMEAIRKAEQDMARADQQYANDLESFITTLRTSISNEAQPSMETQP